jgi:hypothetical protein
VARATYEVEPGESFVAVIGGMPDETGKFNPSYPPPGIAAGQMGVQVRALAGGGAIVPRTTSPREEAPNSAIYATVLTAPPETGSFVVLWDYNAGAAPFFSQTLEVGTGLRVTSPGGEGDGLTLEEPVYITKCEAGTPPKNIDLEAGIQGLVVDNPVTMDRLIVQCEWEVDSILGTWVRDPKTGRKINPNLVVPVAPISPFPGELFAPFQRGVTIYQRNALRRAVCAQVEYHLTQGEDFFRRPQYSQVSGPQFSRTGAADRIAPKARQHLAGTGLIRATARLRP